MVSIPLSQNVLGPSVTLEDPSLGCVMTEGVALETEGLVTVDTSVISPRKGENLRKRKLNSSDGGNCVRRKGEEESDGAILGDVVLEGKVACSIYQDLTSLNCGEDQFIATMAEVGQTKSLNCGEQLIATITEVGQRKSLNCGDEQFIATMAEVGQEEVAVNWQDWEEGAGQVVEFPESTTTINLRDLE